MCVRRADFACRTWLDGSVLFDDANGQLQFLTPSAGIIMGFFLEKDSWSPAEMAQALFDTPPTSEDIELVGDAFAHFLSLKLIERFQD